MREKEWQIEQLKEQIEKEESDGKFEEKLLLCQVRVCLFAYNGDGELAPLTKDLTEEHSVL